VESSWRRAVKLHSTGQAGFNGLKAGFLNF
jgi:hypothetical protein